MGSKVQQDSARVLARKYRPYGFADLVGQDVLVKTLSHAILRGKLPHAILLTGIRGVGKTTTARILARIINCVGRKLTVESLDPCNECSNCSAILNDRHIDVIEMDAASHTGVDDIRDIIEACQYHPVDASMKIYIIDEVHMLSRSAFAALLKTLEEPHSQVLFIFATTDIRKVPAAIISRCMRFDLRRLDRLKLADHLEKIASAERTDIDRNAAMLLADVSEGSVRDAMSLLDQAISLSHGKVTVEIVNQLLGRADENSLESLLTAALTGDVQNLLDSTQKILATGADPSIIIQDLLGICHQLTIAQVNSDIVLSDGLRSFLERVSQAQLHRAWQILLKGLEECQVAPIAEQACEMVLLRLAHLASWPTPSEIISNLLNAGNKLPTHDQVVKSLESDNELVLGNNSSKHLDSFEKIVALFAENRQPLLHASLLRDIEPLEVKPGLLKVKLRPGVQSDLIQKMSKFLKEWTSISWCITIDNSASGGLTLREEEKKKHDDVINQAISNPLVQEALTLFPDSKISVSEIEIA